MNDKGKQLNFDDKEIIDKSLDVINKIQKEIINFDMSIFDKFDISDEDMKIINDFKKLKIKNID
jgi:hypothetical protein